MSKAPAKHRALEVSLLSAYTCRPSSERWPLTRASLLGQAPANGTSPASRAEEALVHLAEHLQRLKVALLESWTWHCCLLQQAYVRFLPLAVAYFLCKRSAAESGKEGVCLWALAATRKS